MDETYDASDEQALRDATAAERYHEAMGLPPASNPNVGTPGVPLPVASPEDRYLLLLDAVAVTARGEDPQRTGPAFTAEPGDFPLGALVRYVIPARDVHATVARPARIEPEQTGIGVVIEYAAGDAPRPHVLLCEDGTYRQVEFTHLTEA